jgi:hypothetical protein
MCGILKVEIVKSTIEYFINYRKGEAAWTAPGSIP